jgi:NADH-quinone oxidoreductase subunit L
MTPSILVWLILLTPFLGFIMPILLGRKHNGLAAWLTISFTGLNLIFSVLLLLQNLHSANQQLAFNWFVLGEKTYHFGFLIDSLTLLMLVLVNFIALLVQIFSLEYMQEDPDQYRYVGFLSLFVFSMLGIVLTDNLWVMYAFWELVGLSSYLLIGFWYQKPAAVQASKKAFLVNRVGDIGFLLGIFLVYYIFGNADIRSLNTNFSQYPNVDLIPLAGLLLFCGCVGKSAQFPLHTWLPDAMEGPTPVSALIHAATMVVAGVYLVARIHPLFGLDESIIVASIGCFTMLLGSVYAIFQTDIKKTLAYSTISQVGLMVIGLGTDASVFHLLTHAFFKAGLFLSAGSVIHSLHHTGHHFDAQDMRLMGGLRKRLPITFICYLICSLALAGLPFFAGFLSKDSILAHLFSLAEQHQSNALYVITGFFFIGILLSAFYMTRQVWMVFFGTFRNEQVQQESIHEGTWKITFPIALLAILSTGFVFTLNPLDAESSWFWNFMNPNWIEKPSENHWIAYLSTAIALLGIGLGYFLRNKIFTFQLPTLDIIYEILLIKPALNIANRLQKFDKQRIDKLIDNLAIFQVVFAHIIAWLDSTIIDGIPNGVAFSAGIIGRVTRSFQSGKVQLYIAMSFLGLISLIIFIIFSS